MGLNASQLYTGAGVSAETVEDYRDKKNRNQQTYNETKESNRREDASNRAAVTAGLLGTDFDQSADKEVGDALATGKAPKGAGLKDTTTGKAGSGTGGKAGLKTSETKSTDKTKGKDGKGGFKYGDISLRENMAKFTDTTLPLSAGERDDEDNFFQDLGTRIASSQYTPFTKPNRSRMVASKDLQGFYSDMVDLEHSPLTNPAQRKKAGLPTSEDLDAFREDMNTQENKVTEWFASRPGASAAFKEDTLEGKVHTMKVILNEISSSDGTDEETAKAAADASNKALKDAGVPGKSTFETAPPDTKWTLSLIDDPGKASDEIVRAEKDRQLKRNALATLGDISIDDATGTQGQIFKAEIKLADANVMRLWGLQAVNQFNGGDPRLAQKILSDKFQRETLIQSFDDGTFTVMHRDENGELYPRVGSEGVSQPSISASLKRLTDETYDAEYKSLAAATQASQTEHLQELEKIALQGELDIDKEIAKARAEAQGKLASGESVEFKQGTLDGEPVTLKNEGGVFSILKPGAKLPNGKRGLAIWEAVNEDFISSLQDLKTVTGKKEA